MDQLYLNLSLKVFIINLSLVIRYRKLSWIFIGVEKKAFDDYNYPKIMHTEYIGYFNLIIVKSLVHKYKSR